MCNVACEPRQKGGRGRTVRLLAERVGVGLVRECLGYVGSAVSFLGVNCVGLMSATSKVYVVPFCDLDLGRQSP